MNMYEQVVKNDQRLKDLATYFESKGLTAVPNNKEEADRFMRAVQFRFAEFKTRILKSNIPIEDIETMVLEQFGIYDKNTQANRESKFGFSDL